MLLAPVVAGDSAPGNGYPVKAPPPLAPAWDRQRGGDDFHDLRWLVKTCGSNGVDMVVTTWVHAGL